MPARIKQHRVCPDVNFCGTRQITRQTPVSAIRCNYGLLAQSHACPCATNPSPASGLQLGRRVGVAVVSFQNAIPPPPLRFDRSTSRRLRPRRRLAVGLPVHARASRPVNQSAAGWGLVGIGFHGLVTGHVQERAKSKHPPFLS